VLAKMKQDSQWVLIAVQLKNWRVWKGYFHLERSRSVTPDLWDCDGDCDCDWKLLRLFWKGGLGFLASAPSASQMKHPIPQLAQQLHCSQCSHGSSPDSPLSMPILLSLSLSSAKVATQFGQSRRIASPTQKTGLEVRPLRRAQLKCQELSRRSNHLIKLPLLLYQIKNF